MPASTPGPVLDQWLALRLEYSAAVSRKGPRSADGRKAAQALCDFWVAHADRYRELMADCEEVPW